MRVGVFELFTENAFFQLHWIMHEKFNIVTFLAIYSRGVFYKKYQFFQCRDADLKNINMKLIVSILNVDQKYILTIESDSFAATNII